MLKDEKWMSPKLAMRKMGLRKLPKYPSALFVIPTSATIGIDWAKFEKMSKISQEKTRRRKEISSDMDDFLVPEILVLEF